MAYKGKAIYNPSGKAGEYSYWACNFYNGCSNGCEYCYCKKGLLAHTMGGGAPTLKACFRDEEHALEVFEKELVKNLPELQAHGLFFSFSTDPMLPETIELTWAAVIQAIVRDVPVKILTKCASWLCECDILGLEFLERKDLVAFGFTLTGHDEIEPGASTNTERIEAMRKLHAAGFKTFASIEPIIDFDSSFEMIKQTIGICDLYKIGVLSGGKYSIFDTLNFVAKVYTRIGSLGKIYFKDSLLKLADIDREHELPGNCVDRDFNLFRTE